MGQICSAQTSQQQHAVTISYSTTDAHNADFSAYCFKDKGITPELNYFKFNPLHEEDIRIKIKYFGLSHADLGIVRGEYQKVKYPLVPGIQFVGEIISAGSKVQTLKVGDNVAVAFLRGEQAIQQFSPNLGGFATHTQLNYKNCIYIPKKIDLSKLPPMLIGGLSLYSAFKRQTKPGKSACVYGLGSLGQIALKLGRAMKLNMKGLTHDSKKSEMLREMGFQYESQQECKTENKKFDYVVFTGRELNQENLTKCLSLLKNGGKLIIASIPSNLASFKTAFFILIAQQLSIVGATGGSREQAKELMELMMKESVYPMTKEFEYSHLVNALNELNQKKPLQKLIVKCPDVVHH